MIPGYKPVETAYLHIGTEKTGTTTLQHYLEQERNDLKNQKILYPVSGCKKNHWGLLVYAMAAEREDRIKFARKLTDPNKVAALQETFKQGILDEAHAHKGMDIVLSLEQLSSRLNDQTELEKIAHLFQSIAKTTKIIVYLRPQTEYLTSWYSTQVKTGQRTKPFSFPTPADDDFDRYDYQKLLDRWGRVFGKENLIVRVFQKSRLLNNNIVDDFLHTLGRIPKAASLKNASLNQSLDPETVEVLRKLNPHLGPLVSPQGINPHRRGVVTFMESISDGRPLTISQENHSEFMSQFSKSNAEIARQYLNISDGRLFDEKPYGPSNFFDSPPQKKRSTEFFPVS